MKRVFPLVIILVLLLASCNRVKRKVNNGMDKVEDLKESVEDEVENIKESVEYKAQDIKESIENKADDIRASAENFKESVRKEFNPTTAESFERRTGLSLICEQKNLIELDTYFPHEGEYSQIFSVTAEQIEIWKNGKAPWDKEEWLTTALPLGITNKFDESVNISGNLIYAYNETCCPDRGIRFNDGQALILDIDSHKVWYVGWNW